MEKAIFPIVHSWETQHMNEGSHKDTLAIDCGVLNPYNDTELYAPFTGTIVYVDAQSKGGGIAFQSDNKVKYVNGTEDYMTIWTGHDNKPPKVGTKFKQGELYSHMGTAGGVAKHCHLEVQKGKFKMATKVTSVGSYKFDNAIEPYNALFFTKDTLFKYSNYKWTIVPEIEVTPVVDRNESVNQIKVIVSQLRVRSGHSTTDSMVGYAVENGIYNDLETFKDTYTWHKIAENQWVADNGEWLELLPVKDYKTLYENEVKINNELKTTNETLTDKNNELQETINNLQLKMKEINRLSQ